ncbi:MAG TPA: PIN domain-containing protein [Candidatus Nanopelagicaceae bacterium]|nr:PIN domain-containing protein [Candidatus Nanopelagicaceae bacterium]
MTGQVVAVVTQELIDELTVVLVRPEFRRWILITDAVSFSEELAAYADPRAAPAASTRRLRDPADDYLVALAESADAAS